MKKRIFLILAIFLLSCQSNSVFAMMTPLYHECPSCPVVDVAQDSAQIAGNAQTMQNQVMQMYQQAVSDLNNLKTAALGTFEDIKSGAVLTADGNPGQAETTYCGKSLTKVKPRKMSKDLINTFMLYKSSHLEDISHTKKIREKFYIDNIYAIHAASILIQGQLKEEGADSIKQKIENAKACAKGEGSACGIPSTDEGGNNEVLFGYGATLDTMDSIVRLWESVAALKARLRAVEALMRLEPMVKTKSDKAAYNDNPLIPIKSFAQVKHSDKLAFAQMVQAAPKNTIDAMTRLETKVSGAKSESLQLIGKTLTFTEANESTKESPLVAAESKLQTLTELNTVENDVNNAMTAHNMLYQLKSYKEMADSYAEMKKDYDKALQKLQESEQCAVKYLSKYFSNPITVWSGINLSKTPYAHHLRKGISGWAFEAYETAKSAETSIITTDDVAMVSIDDKEMNDLIDDPDHSKSEKYSQNLSAPISTNKQEQNQAEIRKSELRTWEIGAEAAKMLGTDAAKWGAVGGKPMVWTDTKNFYQQYLRRKYDNVKSYLKSYTRNDILALVVAKLKGQTQDINDTNYQKKLREDEASSAKKMLANIKSAVQTKQKLDAQSSSSTDGLQKQRAALVAKMDKLSAEIKESKDAIADTRAVAAEKATQQVDEAINAELVFPSSKSRVNTIVGSDKLEKAMAESKSKQIDTKKISSLEKQAAANQKKLDSYQSQLENLDAKIVEAKWAAQEQNAGSLDQGATDALALQSELAESIKLNDENYTADVRKNLMAILSKSAVANPLLNPAVMMAAAETAADEALNKLYNQVDIIIDGGYQQMMALGDDLYRPESQARLAEIHNQMISQIKGLMLTYSVVGLITVKDIAVYAKLETADTSAETEGFFVGSPAKARDMKAPYAIPNFNLPPVREVFHFDGDDFTAIKPRIKGKNNTGRSLSASDFLNYGGEIPAIWQHMLKDYAFIESRYNLKEALNYGCSDVAFSRGGIMPCVIEGSSIILDVNSKGEYIRRSDLNASSLPKCLLVSLEKGKPYHKVWKTNVIFAPTGGFLSKIKEEKPFAPDCAYSELGMLLEADENNNLKFKQRAFAAFNDLPIGGNEKSSDKDKNKIAATYHASLMRNQIGDFLRQAENEKLVRENVDEYKQKYEKAMDELKSMLRQYGFEPSASFDLTKESDYKLAANKLQGIKTRLISQASSAISKVDQTDNPPVQEKIGIFNKLIAAMKNDTDAVRKVSLITADETDTAAQLKKAKADRAVVDKYKKGLKEQGKDYNSPDEPFCANY